MNLLQSLIFLAVFVCSYAAHRKTPLIQVVARGGDHFEGPHWSVSEQALYWVDISGQSVHRLDYATGNITKREIAYGPVSLVTSVKDNPGLVLVTVRTEVYFLSWNSSVGDPGLRLLSSVDLGLPDNRCNDGKIDAKGRLWLGTMGPEINEQVAPDQGTLYILDENTHIHPQEKVRPVSVSNGIAWTSDSKYMFYIDTPTTNIDVFDFDLPSGTLRNRRTLFSFKANNVTGFPDGMTIDSQGNLWIACFNGWKVIKVDSRSGKLLEEHKIPVQKVTSVMFGGPDLSTLYVTTSQRGLTPEELTKQPDAGSLFKIENTGAKGLPENQFVFADASLY